MNRLVQTLLLILITLTLSAQKYVQVWGDEFNTPGLPDSTKWGYEMGKIRNAELQYYTSKRLENARIEDSVLIIEARKEKYSGADYTSASIISKGIGDWKYGKIEISAKVPTGKGTWPALWMLPTNSEYGWPASGEIDIMEYIGVEPQNLFYTCHFEGTNGTGHQSSGAKSSTTANPFNQFIKFTLIWTPDKIEWYANDRKYHQYLRTSNDIKLWPFNKEFYLILNLAYGGSWGGYGGVDDTKLPHKFLIDYVRVFQLQETESPFSLTVAPFKHGKVEVSPKMDLYPENTEVSFTAIPDSGYLFKAWEYQSGANPFRLVMNKNTVVNPLFFNPKELISNGKFDKNLLPWAFYRDNTQTISYKPSVVDSTFVFDVTKTTGTDWQVGFQQLNLSLEKTNYKLKFDAWAEQSKQLLITVSKNYPNWSSYLSKYVNLTTSRKSFELTLAIPVADDNVRLYFGAGKFTGKLYFDNISLTKIEDGPLTGNNEINLKENSFPIYPNPTNNAFTVNLSNFSKLKEQQLELLTLDGKLIYQTKLLDMETEINPGQMKPGIYLVKVRSDKTSFVKKILIY